MKETLVRDWMTLDPITVSSSCTLPDAYWMMINNNVRMRANIMLMKLPVSRVMTENPKTIEVNAALLKAARLMLEHKISTLPVMEGSKLVGIITESDIFRALVKQLES